MSQIQPEAQGCKLDGATVYVEVVVNVPGVSGVFHYHLPVELTDQVKIGSLVLVPFGAQTVQGVILRQVVTPAVTETRPVLGLVDSQAVLTEGQIRLAEWLSESTLSPLTACIHLMLPPGLSQQADTLFYLRTPDPIRMEPDSETLHKRLVDLIQKRGPLRGAQIDAAFPRVDWRPTARRLVRSGVLASQSVLSPPKVQTKFVRTARLGCPPEAAAQQMDSLGKKGSAALIRRQSMLRLLMQETDAIDVAWLYAGSGGKLQDLSALEERGLVVLGETEAFRDPLGHLEFIPSQPPILTADQQHAWESIKGFLDASVSQQPAPAILLHGVTGSGKTELYLRAVQGVILRGKQAIVLVPEIALTPQTVRRFTVRFPGQVGLVHSGLSAGERYDTWRRAREGQLSLVVGPRSALFTPFPRLGLIVVDESHEDTYYQSDSMPHFHAREAALAYAQICGAVCLMGSATPDLTSFTRAQDGQYQYIHLPNRILAHQEAIRTQLDKLGASLKSNTYQPYEGQAQTTDLPQVKVVDMRVELKAGNRSIFSRDLQSGLQTILEQHEQAILFLNRRGSATYVFCRDCGYSLKCPRCETPLIAHQHAPATQVRKSQENPVNGLNYKLLCHHCGYSRQIPASCPACGSKNIRQFGTGTERVEQEVLKLFPQARTLRWDWETTRQKGAHDLILGHFMAHRADVLVGTQMLAKGLDLPFITLVGVVLADVGLGLPDYTAAERTFQVLAQVAGRAGRSPLGGRVILQTFMPENYTIQAAANHDYLSFAARELKYRRELGYPPYVNLVRLEYRHANATRAEATARAFGEIVDGWLRDEGSASTRRIGPTPPFFARREGLFRWQIILKGPDPVALLRKEERMRLLSDWVVEVNPPSLL